MLLIQDDFIEAGLRDSSYANLVEIASDEKTHVSFLTMALGLAACNYSFPSSTPAQFVALAFVLEDVEVSAYLGAADPILNKTYLTDAGSILTIEARHNSYLRASLTETPLRLSTKSTSSPHPSSSPAPLTAKGLPRTHLCYDHHRNI